jgi:hypothetical protein
MTRDNGGEWRATPEVKVTTEKDSEGEYMTREGIFMVRDREKYLDYTDFVNDMDIVDENDPEQVKKHQEKLWNMVCKRISRKDPMTEEQTEKLRAFYDKYHTLWNVLKKGAPPAMNDNMVKPLEIKLLDETPVHLRRYRRSPAEYAIIKEYLELLLRNNIVEPSVSPWTAPIVIVKKADGSPRICINYQKLNAQTEKDRYPMPKVDDLLDQLGTNAWFDSWDLLSGYWQLPVAEKSKKLTSFTTPFGTFQWNRAPMGLANSGAAFCRAMDCVLAGIKGINCLAYVDDLLIFSNTFDEHIDNMSRVAQRLIAAGITLKAQKCSTCCDEVEFLGYIVTSEGIKPNPNKTRAIVEWRTPKSFTEVRAFAGTVNYYRRFIRNCSVRMAPLSALTRTFRKGEDPPKWEGSLWTEECQAAFEDLKLALTSAPVMRHPDYTRKFILDVDSEDRGVGAVLSQDFQDGEHPVAYYSKKFAKEIQGWDSTHLEAIGILKSLDHFRPYIGGVDFILRNDNQSVVLSWLRKQRGGKLGRWAARLGEYDGYMEIQHRPGKIATHVDGLSRMGRDENDPGEHGDDCLNPGVPMKRQEVHLNTLNASRGNLPTITEETEKTSMQEVLDQEIRARTRRVRKGMTPLGSNLSNLRRDIGETLWEDLEKHTKRDVGLTAMIQELETRDGRNPPGWKGVFMVRHGLVWREIPENYKGDCRSNWAIAVPYAMRKRILSMFHDTADLAHLGTRKTMGLMATRFWWPKWGEDVKQYVSSCALCQRRKSGKGNKAYSHPKPLREPNYQVSIDIAGAYGNDKGPTHVLTMVCVATGYAEVVPIEDLSTQNVLSKLDQHWVQRHGAPRDILSDRGAQFESKDFAQYCREKGIHKSRTTVENPKANSQSERVHRWLKERVGILVDQYQGKWHQYLPAVVFAHNVSKADGAANSPFTIWYGRAPRITIDGSQI